MILLSTKLDLTKIPVNWPHNSHDQSQHINQYSQSETKPQGSDGAFLDMDSEGEVKLLVSGGTEDASFQNGPEITAGIYQRPDVSFFDRLEIAWRFWNPERPWGTVTELAEKYGLSRQSIYKIARKAKQGVDPMPPGPKSTREQVLCEPTCPQVSPLTNEQADQVRGRIALTSVFPAGVTMRPLEEILNEVPSISSCSDTTIWRIINQAGQKADQILSEVDYKKINLPLVFAAIDETFFNGYPILFVVEPISLAICAYYIPPDKDRSADNWSCLLELLKKEQNLNIIGGLGDAAKAFPKAFKQLLGNEESFSEDVFHLLYAVKRLAFQLERQAYSALNQVEDLQEKLDKQKVKLEKVEQARQEAAQKVHIYDEFYQIADWISDGLEMIDLSSGEIRDREINGWLLDVAIEEMKKLEHDKIKKMAKRLKNHKKKLLKYLDWLNGYLCEPIDQLHQYLNDKQLERYIMNLIARYWRVDHAVESLKYRTLRPLRDKLRKEVEFCTAGDQWLSNWTQNVFQLFSSIQRTSSAVENINSILKPMIRSKKHFGSSQNMEYFVALFALWHNLRRFKEGKRKGKSPFDILGIQMPSDDWRTLLGYPPTS